MKTFFKLTFLVFAMTFWSISAAFAGKFSTIIQVNDSIITQYEMDQRKLMLQAFNTAGDLDEIATKQLIDERLQLQAGRQLNIVIPPEQIEIGMEEFASRGNLTLDQILQYLQSRGIATQSYRDFVKAGMTWREVVRARFGRRAQVTEDELDSTLALSQGNSVREILISEIIIPTAERGNQGARDLATRLSKSLKSQSAFSAAARRYSRSPSARNGGKVDWIPAGNLPPRLLTQLLVLERGEVTDPVDLNGAVAIFQLRGLRSGKGSAPAETTLGFAEVTIPKSVGDSKTQAAQVRVLINKSDTCLDLRANSEGFGSSSFSEDAGTPSDLPQQQAMALAKLDPNEAGFYQTTDGSYRVIMLCSRTRDLPEGARDELRDSLFNRKISGLGDGYLQELRGDAIIVYK